MGLAQPASAFVIGVGFLLAINLFFLVDLAILTERRERTPQTEDIAAADLSEAEVEAALEAVAHRVFGSSGRWEHDGPFLDQHCHLYWVERSKRTCESGAPRTGRMISLDLSTVEAVRQERPSATRTEVVFGRHTLQEFQAKSSQRPRGYYDPVLGPDDLLVHRTRIADVFGTHSFEFETHCDGLDAGFKHGVRFVFSEPILGERKQAEMEASLEALVGHCRAYLGGNVAEPGS